MVSRRVAPPTYAEAARTTSEGTTDDPQRVRDLSPIRLGPLFRTWAPLGPAWPISLSRSSRGSWHSLLRSDCATIIPLSALIVTGLGHTTRGPMKNSPNMRARWPLGTRERLAFALLLYTGQRVGDVVKLKRSDISDGMIQLVQQKTGVPLSIPIHPALERAIRMGPTKGLYLVGDQNGRPIAAASLTRLIKRAVAIAELPDRCKPHGLRKAILRRLAEHGATAKQIAAVSGHKTLGEVERYTRAADQVVMSKAALELLPDEK